MKTSDLKLSFYMLLLMFSLNVTAQKTGTIGKLTYPVYGNYLATWKDGVFVRHSETDSARIYAKIAGDTLYATHELYRKGVLKGVVNDRVAYKHSKIKISKPDKDAFYGYQITVKSDYDESNNVQHLFFPTHDSKGKSSTISLYLRFQSKESSEAFYNNLMSGTGTESAPSGQKAPVTASKEEKTTVKVALKNKGNDKIEILYQKKAGAKDLSGETINQGSQKEISVEPGSNVYYRVNGSKGPLLITITEAMNGTTQLIK